MHPAAAQAASPKLARRDAIIEIAMRHFSERSYEDVYIGDVCREAGVAHGLVSYYFGNKRGLFSEIVRQAWEEKLAYEAPRDDELTATDRVRGYIRRHLEYVQQHAAQYTGLMLNENGNPEIREITHNARVQGTAALINQLGCPANPPVELRAALIGWEGFRDSVTTDWLTHGGLDLDEVVGLCTNTLVAVVRIASGSQFDAVTEEETLLQVSHPNGRVARPATSPPRTASPRRRVDGSWWLGSPTPRK